MTGVERLHWKLEEEKAALSPDDGSSEEEKILVSEEEKPYTYKTAEATGGHG